MLRVLLTASVLAATTAPAASLLAAPRRAPPSGGLGGLGAPGGLGAVDPRAAALELELLGRINAIRKKAGAAPLVMDEKMRAFGRREAETAARAGVDVPAADARLREEGLAASAHRLQFAFGRTAARVMSAITRDPALSAALVSDYERAGIGAFWAPADRPFFQVLLVLVRDNDPMAGKPGLSPAETDPVVSAAEPRVRACYDAARRTSPELEGDVLFQLVIGASGAVQSARLLRGFGVPAFDGCALAVMRGLRFPAPYKGKPVTLNQPMRLAPPAKGPLPAPRSEAPRHGPPPAAGPAAVARR